MSIVLSHNAKSRPLTNFEACKRQIKRWLGEELGEFTQTRLENILDGCTILILEKIDEAVGTLAREIITKMQREYHRNLAKENTFMPLPILQGLCAQSMAFAYGGIGVLTASEATSALVFLSSGLGGAGAFFALTLGGLHLFNDARPVVRKNLIRAAWQEAREKIEKERDKILTGLLRYRVKLMTADSEKKEQNYNVQIARFDSQLQRAVEKANGSELKAEVDRACHHLVTQIMANVLKHEQQGIVKALVQRNCDLISHGEMITAQLGDLQQENRENLTRVEQAHSNARKATLMAEQANADALKACNAVAESRALLTQALARADAADITASELRNANFAIEKRFETKLHNKFNALIAALNSHDGQRPVRELFQSTLQHCDVQGPPTPESQEIQVSHQKELKDEPEEINAMGDDEFECIEPFQSSLNDEQLHRSSWQPDSQDIAASILMEMSEKE